jgi:succinate dehydrogenase/fumarate reductase cytochrome b subunit
MGPYRFFDQGVDVFATHGSGGIRHVVNDAGGGSTSTNADVPVTVVDYP